uniref:Uncharacterized protein n=1 Tax=Knipowitschia caucasica TaxID=637954 RepID=A0AAV2MLG8_KNICA
MYPSSSLLLYPSSSLLLYPSSSRLLYPSSSLLLYPSSSLLLYPSSSLLLYPSSSLLLAIEDTAPSCGGRCTCTFASRESPESFRCWRTQRKHVRESVIKSICLNNPNSLHGSLNRRLCTSDRGTNSRKPLCPSHFSHVAYDREAQREGLVTSHLKVKVFGQRRVCDSRVNVTMASEREQIPGTISEEAAGGSTEPGVCVRTTSSVSSAVSLKSDWSMRIPPNFSLEAASSKPQ